MSCLLLIRGRLLARGERAAALRAPRSASASCDPLHLSGASSASSSIRALSAVPVRVCVYVCAVLFLILATERCSSVVWWCERLDTYLRGQGQLIEDTLGAECSQVCAIMGVMLVLVVLAMASSAVASPVESATTASFW